LYDHRSDGSILGEEFFDVFFSETFRDVSHINVVELNGLLRFILDESSRKKFFSLELLRIY
jgi:hypothetical protein